MKLLNQSLLYLFVPLFLVISIWAVVFYVSMLDEVYDSIDDGLDNSKLLIIRKAREDSSVLARANFAEGNYAMRRIERDAALVIKDEYRDTLMYMLNEEAMEPVRLLTTAFQQGDAYYELKVINSMVEEDDQIANLFWSVLLLYLLLLVSIALINNIVLKKLWQPFYDYLEQLKGYRIDRDEPLEEMQTTTREFMQLKASADTLIRHSREIYRKQKRFNENAAHELQTPLAVITNKLELLLEEDSLSAHDAATVAQVMQTTSRLIKLNKSLLLLSKIENKQFFDNHETSLNEQLGRVVNELEDLIDYRDLTLTYPVNDPLAIEMDAHLAYILVANLIRNAIFHNHDGGNIEICFIDRTLTVRNTSATPALDADRVFDRFYRAGEGRGGSGLGLAIVSAICELYGFGLSYEYATGHSFTVRFK